MTRTAPSRIESPAFEVIDVRFDRGSRLRRAARRGWEWLRTWPARSRMQLGSGVRLAPPIWTLGERAIRIGDGAAIWHHGRLIALNADDGETRIDIGPRAAIHPFVHISAVKSVRIGMGAMFASNVYVSDHDHDWRDPDEPPTTNGRVLAAPVDIGAWVWLGERVCVLRGVSIGEGTIVGAGSVVTRSLPARCIAVGAPARVIRRWDEASRQWVAAG